jgi:hypothetical protein
MAKQWYMAVGGHQVGPVSEDEIRQNLANGTIDAATLLFAEGMSAWTPVRDVPEFRAGASGTGPAAPPPVPAGAPTRSTPRSTARTCSSSRSSSTLRRASWPRRAR